MLLVEKKQHAHRKLKLLLLGRDDLFQDLDGARVSAALKWRGCYLLQPLDRSLVHHLVNEFQIRPAQKIILSPSAPSSRFSSHMSTPEMTLVLPHVLVRHVVLTGENTPRLHGEHLIYFTL